MRNKNTVYTVTPPDLRLNMIGPSVLLLGVTMETSTPYIEVYDNLFPEVEITFFVSEDGFNDKHTPWFRAAAGIASSIFVNLDNISAEEVLLAIEAEHDKTTLVYWISEKQSYPGMIQLLNSYQYQIFNSLDNVEKFIMDEYGKTS